MLSEKEIAILKAHNSGLPLSKIAEKFKLSNTEAELLIETATSKMNNLRELAKEREIPAYIRTVDNRIDEPQKGTMKVGSQILKHLSEGIYSSPAAALKELISNSFDSDAPEVRITITDDVIEIQDTGHGMNWKDFDADFTFISHSIKRNRKSNNTPDYNRPIIGFLGIGFISVSELCDKLLITSCRKNEKLFFEAEIDFSKYRERETIEKEFYEVSEYQLTNYLKKDKQIPENSQFTKIKLCNLRPGFKEILNDLKPFNDRNFGINEILDHCNRTGQGITDLGKYWQMLWELAYMCPIKYLPDGPISQISEPILTNIRSTIESFNFEVTINEIELRKPFKFPNEETKYSIHPFSETLRTSEGPLSFRGYLYSQHGMISPKEYIGSLIRVKNVGIGEIDRTFLGYSSSSNQLFRNWVFGEIYVDNGLEEALNINRNRFKVTHPAYIALKGWLHTFLSNVVFKYTLYEYYRKTRIERQESLEEQNTQILNEIVQSEMGKSYRLRFQKLEQNQPILIERESKTVIINSNYTAFQTKMQIKKTMQRTLLLFEIAVEKSAGDLAELKNIFMNGIQKWLNQ